MDKALLPLNGVSLKSVQKFLNFTMMSSGISTSDFNSFILLKGVIKSRKFYKAQKKFTRSSNVLEREKRRKKHIIFIF